jgi:hypothetical protein
VRFAAWRARVALAAQFQTRRAVFAPRVLVVDPRRIVVRQRFAAGEEAVVGIGPRGQMVLERGQIDGDLPLVRVRVRWRHPAWLRLREEILAYAAAHGGRTYQPLLHPDLLDIPNEHSDARFELIRAHLPVQSGALLDIGSHWGYFCHRFEDLGFRCLAVESEPAAVYFMDRLRRAEGKRFKSLNADVLDLPVAEPFDVVLALNIFHHFLKTERDYQRLSAFLRRLQTQVMVFEPHRAEEEQMAGAYRNFAPEDFVRFVSEHTGLSHAQRLGEVEEGRSVYLLSRGP